MADYIDPTNIPDADAADLYPDADANDGDLDFPRRNATG
jgi:hypothetical protein